MEEQEQTPARPFPTLESQAKLLIPLALLLGLALRLYNSYTTALNPDECWHASISQPADWATRSLQVHHPPLLFVLLHYLQTISNSELVLRLPSILAGWLCPWVIFKSLQRLKLPTGALFAFLLLEFSANLIHLSCQLRGYTLALFFTASAFYFLEGAIERRSYTALTLFAGSLYLAILSEFSVAFATFGLGLYALLRILPQLRPWPFSLAWAATQLGALGLYAYLYFTSIANLLGDPNSKALIAGYLSGSFPRPGQNPMLFSAGAVWKQFGFLGSSTPIGAILALLFLPGLFLLWRAMLPGKQKTQSRPLLIAILGTLALALAAALARLHPFGPLRHALILALFTLIPCATTVHWIFHRFPRLNPFALPGLLGGTALLIILAPPPPIKSIDNHFAPEDIRQGAEQLEAEIPKDAIIFTDDETSWLLSHYWQRRSDQKPQTPSSPFRQYSIGPYRTYTLSWDHISYQIIANDLAALRRHENIPPTQPIYVLDSGFNKLPAQGWNARDLSNALLLLRPD